MDALSFMTVFTFVALGLAIGMVVGITMNKEGISVPQNLLWGTAGSLITGYLAIVCDIGLEFLFSIVGTVAILFLANVFHQHHEEDIFGNIDRGIRIARK